MTTQMKATVKTRITSYLQNAAFHIDEIEHILGDRPYEPEIAQAHQMALNAADSIKMLLDEEW